MAAIDPLVNLGDLIRAGIKLCINERPLGEEGAASR
jgi:hypothetical protein